MKKIISLVALFPYSALAFTGEATTAPSASGINSVSDFYDVIQIAARWLVVFGIIIGAVFIIIGGIQYMTAGGDEAGTSAAKAKIIGGLIGIALVLLAFAVVNIVGSFFGAGTIVS
jgi:predicted small integral membrane protein